ncbi:hypothetical protein EVAR_48990_1 [Eumeta japonica]|uniref:Zinc finger MYM-type protein 1 n=1 Tax=Eumeta variegata TaxID=151549 RepID=A0A4C1Z231_EUMVA|nr:hypothetical protein EVAR_48990_1 [Eumeta japonica]
MSLTFRFVDVNEEEVDVRECFVAYKPICDSSGAGITGLFLDTIVQEFDLDMNDCRGQGYDNGANMVGVNKGVQSRILNLYSRAFFNPCGCHSLNLVIADTAKSSVKSISLFGFLQRLFVLFSGSTKRWEVISKHIEGLSLKKFAKLAGRVEFLVLPLFALTTLQSVMPFKIFTKKPTTQLRHQRHCR